MDECSSSSSCSDDGHDLVDISSPISSGTPSGAMGTMLVVGCTGFLGQYLTAEAVGQGWDVHALVRLGAQDDPRKDAIRNCFNSLGVKLVYASYDDHESLVKACTGVDVVLSCIGPSGIDSQLKLVDAARDAGSVKRFVPSEFGAYTKAACNSGIAGKYGAKRAVQEALEKSGLGYTYVTSYCLTSFWGPGLGMLGRAEPPADVIEVLGDGTAKGIFVDEMDVARFTVRALSDSRTLNTSVHICPRENRLSQNDLISLWELKTGSKLRREYIPPSAIEDAIRGTDDPCASALLQLEYCMFVLGESKSRPEPCDVELTELYPDMPYVRLADYLDNFHGSHFD